MVKQPMQIAIKSSDLEYLRAGTAENLMQVIRVC